MGDAPDGDDAARAAVACARRPLAAGRLLARRLAAAGSTPPATPRRCPRSDDPARAWTAVEREGRRVGAIVHDRSLCEDDELIRSVAVAAGLSIENERLQAQLRARVEELRRSRARIVEAGTAERRRLERNLHDGAQQRLVALSLTLRLAQGRLKQGPRRRREAARRRPGRAGARARGAARAGPRNPSRRAVRPRAARGARGARRPLAGAGRARRHAAASGCRRRSRPPPTSSWPRR